MASRRVWVIDDELPIRSVLSRRFELSGFETRIAASGVEALEYLDEDVPDAIVVDLQMPGMTGVEFATELRSRVDASPVVVLLTARSHLAEDEDVDAAGISRVMIKPFSAREVVRLVESLLDGANARSVA